MIKVVIADDEVRVCQLICNLIDWKSLDMEIVAVAYNGYEALDRIKNLQPDLIITDIRMPGCDGLELINLAKQIKKDIEFIIISGYSHFEYAQSAIKYGVSDYILKPINKNELLNTLKKIRIKHRQKTEQLSKEEQLTIRLQNDIYKLRSSFITEILLPNDVQLDNIKTEKINEDYHYKFQSGFFQGVIVKIDCEYEDLSKIVNILNGKTKQILCMHLTPECFDMELYFKNSRAYCILNYAVENQKNIRKKLRTCLEEILHQKSFMQKVEFTIGIGPASEGIGQLKESLKMAEWAVMQRLIDGTGKLIDGTEQDFSVKLDDVMADFIKEMEASLEILDSNGLSTSINSLKEHVLDKPGIVGQQIFRLALDIYNIFLMQLRNFHYYMENMEGFYETFYERANLCSSAWELFAFLSKSIEESLHPIIEAIKEKDMKPILTAKQYIQQNYMKYITLKEVSGVVGFNDSYFSSLFKKQCGKSFSEYLSEVRMNKAKELLKESNLIVAEICQRVGYSDLKHFTKNFKRLTGLTPNEYRKLYA